MKLAQNKETKIIQTWAKLCHAIGSTRPRKLKKEYILEKWCPENTLDQKFTKQQRPILREILVDSLEGILSPDDLPTNVTRTKEFKHLWVQVHGDIDIAGQNDFRKWADGKFNELDDELWDDLPKEYLSQLTVAYVRLNFLKSSINNIIITHQDWIKEQTSKLQKLEKLVKKNPKYFNKQHSKNLNLAKERISDAKSISNGYSRLIEDTEQHLAVITGDHLFHAQNMGANLPDYIENLSSDIVNKNLDIFNSLLEVDIHDKKGKQDKIAKKISELFDQVYSEREKLDEKRNDIHNLLKQIASIGSKL